MTTGAANPTTTAAIVEVTKIFSKYKHDDDNKVREDFDHHYYHSYHYQPSFVKMTHVSYVVV